MLYTFGATTLSYREFVTHFCTVFEGPYGLQITGAKHFRIPELQSLLKPVMLRRKKEDVMKELPPLTFSELVVEPSPVDIEAESSFVQYATPVRRKELEEILKNQQQLVQTILKAPGTRHDDTIMKSLEAVAQSVSTLRRYTGLQKVPGVAEIVKDELTNNAYDKVVIFAIHRDVIEGLRARLQPFGAVTLYGGFTMEKQQANIDRFQRNPKCRVMIANILCAGTAVTLTAAHQVVFVEQDWVPGNNAQAVMRCHRIGQSRPVFVRFYGLADSIDERVSKILKRKARDIAEIFDSAELTKPKHDYKSTTQAVIPDGVETAQSLEDLLK
jgi:SWI/SNF-related matrix-associated actin-dependent regulator 1 of chromatin subfamily A